MYILFLGEYIVMKIYFFFRMGVCTGVASSGVRALVDGWVLVNRTPCCWVCMCPFGVSSDSGKCLLTFYILTRVHDR